MNGKAQGQLRGSQIITTFGPGALIDLANESVIGGGFDTLCGGYHRLNSGADALAGPHSMTGVCALPTALADSTTHGESG